MSFGDLVYFLSARFTAVSAIVIDTNGVKDNKKGMVKPSLF